MKITLTICSRQFINFAISAGGVTQEAGGKIWLRAPSLQRQAHAKKIST
jgi:hypothetical protein